MDENNSTYDNNIGTALFWWTQWPAVGKPVSMCILHDPIHDAFLLFIRDSLVWLADTLQDVVDVLCSPEHAWLWLWDYNI